MKTEFTMLKVTYGEFGVLGANNYLLTDDRSGEAALIDCSSDKEDMIHFIEGANLKYILLTHGHFDHCDGVKGIAERTGAKIVIAEADHKMSADTTANVSRLFGDGWIAYTPDLLIHDGDILHLGEEEIKVIATPGHTPGSVCYLAGNHLFTGDTIMVGGYGRTDFPGGNQDQLVSSLMKIIPFTKNNNFYPGHGSIQLLKDNK